MNLKIYLKAVVSILFFVFIQACSAGDEKKGMRGTLSADRSNADQRVGGEGASREGYCKISVNNAESIQSYNQRVRFQIETKSPIKSASINRGEMHKSRQNDTTIVIEENVTESDSYVATVITQKGKTTHCSIYLEVADPQPPGCALSASAISVDPGATVTFSLAATGIVKSARINSVEVSLSNPTLALTIQESQNVAALVEGPGGKAECSVNVTVNPPNQPAPPTCTLIASPNSVTAGGSSTLTLTSSLTAVKAFIGTTAVSIPNATKTVTTNSTTRYLATVQDIAGREGNCFTDVTVQSTQPPPPPSTATCSLSANPTSITTGGSSTITLSVTGNATSAILDGSAISATGGFKSVTPTATTIYTGSVTTSGVTRTCSTTVTVNTSSAPPTCSLNASPSSLSAGQTSTLTLTTNGSVTSAILDGTNVTNTSKVKTVTPNATTTYQASVSGPGGSNTCSTTVTLVPASAVNCNITLDPPSIYEGDYSTLTMTTANVDISATINSVDVPLTGITTRKMPTIRDLGTKSVTFLGKVVGQKGSASCSATLTIQSGPADDESVGSWSRLPAAPSMVDWGNISWYGTGFVTCGGYGPNASTAKSMYYDFLAGTWTTIPSSSCEKYIFVKSLPLDTGVFATGGQLFGSTNAGGSRMFSSATKTWSNLPAMPLRPNYQIDGLGDLHLFSNGKDVMVWTYDFNKDDIPISSMSQLTRYGMLYNLQSGTWRQVSQAGARSLKYGELGAIQGNKVALYGGFIHDHGPIGATKINNGHIYDMSTDSWTLIPTGPEDLYDDGFITWVGDKLLYIDGYVPNRLHYYDPATQTWSMVRVTLPAGRLVGDLVLGRLTRTKDYILLWDSKTKPIALDLAKNRWVPMPPAPDTQLDFAVGPETWQWTGETGNPATSNRLIVFGGYDQQPYVYHLQSAAETARQKEIVGEIFRAFLKRDPDAASVTFYVGEWNTYGRDHVIASIAGSGEYFTSSGGTNQGFVTHLYDDLLLRAGDAGGISNWTTALNNGSKTRYDVVIAFLGSNEFKNLHRFE